MSDAGKGSTKEAPPPFRIFLCSTSNDLKKHRQRVAAAIERLSQQVARMETFGAEPKAPLTACREKAASADALVVCVAHRYGWVPSVEESGDGEKSVTWHEVEAALAADKPVFAFVVDPEYAWAGPREQDRLTTATTPEEMLAVGVAVQGLQRFKDYLGSLVILETFTTPNDLALKVSSSLSKWLLEQLPARPDLEIRAAADLTRYLADLIDRTDHINISGISTQHATGALRYPIERLYTPLSSLGILSSLGRVGTEDDDPMAGLRHARINLASLLPRHHRLLIEGQPGAGKTTFVRFAACMLARDVLGEPCPDSVSWRRRYLGLDDEAPRVPVLLRVSDLVSLLTAPDGPNLRHDNRQWLLDLLARSCEADDHPISRDHWRDLLESGEAVLLLDGLDEAADDALRQRVLRIFRDACRKWQCPVVVTSRPIDTAPLKEMGFHPATIEPFGDEEIRTFVDHWVGALHAAEGKEPGAEAERYRDTLTEAIVGRSRVRRLAANPVMLTCLCVVHWNEGRLPEGRSRVYRAVLRWLIAARSRLREEAGYTDLFAWRAFARLALAMTAGEGGKRAAFDLEDAAVVVAPLLERERPELPDQERRQEARAWLTFECLGSGVVEEIGGRRLRFWHLTFQEFLAALELAWRGDGEDEERDWWPIVRDRLDHAQWRETIELLPGCLLDEGGVGRVDRLLARVMEQRGEDADLATDARVAAVLGRLLRTLEVLGYKPSGEISNAAEQALKRAMAIFEPEGAARVPVETRIEAAEALGRGGDPRLAPGVDNSLEVPGVGGKRLGRFPVTVEEYQRFVEGRGYEESQHWSDEGWKLREKEDWETPGEWLEQLERPNRPVVNVSWYEAEAYCNWLGEQRGYQEARLPEEKEWETAAMPERGEFPWGEEEPDPERANFAMNVEVPTPVGVYPRGKGPCGHLDLAGNVWEWCVDEEKVPWAEGEIGRVLRGGGWDYPAGNLRAASRSWGSASSRNSSVGFRVLVVPASL
ncbi:MAG: SUMF1/EgtB/PvdO family nonheme iron enzyme [bacterium]|nr:SUMF1/EgtB/PvdO family nonheme iron enzyme [bacterium]